MTRNIHTENCKYITFTAHDTILKRLSDKVHDNINDAMLEVAHLNFTKTQGLIQQYNRDSGISSFVHYTEPYRKYKIHKKDPTGIHFMNKWIEVGDIITYNNDIPLCLTAYETVYNSNSFKRQRGAMYGSRLKLIRDIDQYIGKKMSIGDVHSFNDNTHHYTRTRWSGDRIDNKLVVSKIYYDAVTFECFKLSGGNYTHRTKTEKERSKDYPKDTEGSILNYSPITKIIRKFKISKNVNPILFMH